jgi:hypothetical protein
MAAHPELLRPLTDDHIAGLDELLAGVEYDPDERLDADFELP